MRSLLATLLAAATCLSSAIGEAAAHPLAGTLWDVRAEQRIDRDALADRLAGADVVILGEVHDNPAHHRAQAWLVGRLKPAGMAFEMIPRADEERVREFLAGGGEPAGIGPAIGWDQSGWPDWALYRPIFQAWRARAYAGGGVVPETLRKAAAEGAAAVVEDRRFAPVLAAALDPAEQAAMEAEMVEAHCGKLPPASAPGMVEVQRLRDASFASAALRAREEAGGGLTVLITGDGHARTDRGVPTYLAAVAPGLEVLSVGLIETQPEARTPADYGTPYDYAWFTAPAERPDPCAAFE